jgi:hypothetical protein
MVLKHKPFFILIWLACLMVACTPEATQTMPVSIPEPTETIPVFTVAPTETEAPPTEEPTQITPEASATVSPTSEEQKSDVTPVPEGGKGGDVEWEYTLNGKGLTVLEAKYEIGPFVSAAPEIDGKQYYPGVSSTIAAPKEGKKYFVISWKTEEKDMPKIISSNYILRLLDVDGNVMSISDVKAGGTTGESDPVGLYMLVVSINKEKFVGRVVFREKNGNMFTTYRRPEK